MLGDFDMMRTVFTLFAVLVLAPTVSWARQVDFSLTCNTPITQTCSGSGFFTYDEIDPCMTGPLPVTMYDFNLASSRVINTGEFNPSSQNLTITSPSCDISGTLTYVKGARTLTITIASGNAVSFTVGAGTTGQSGGATLTIPEPGTLALFATGLTVLVLRNRRRSR